MYNDVFGSSTLPPSEYGFNAFTLTTDATLVWPYNTDNATYTIAKIMQITCGAGNAVTLPDARQVSTGEDFLIRNVGANDLIVKDASGTQIASVAVGAASYFYLTDNTTLAGVFGVIGFGVGTSTVDAASLVGYGIKAVGASLNQSHPVLTTASGITLTADHRSKLVVFTGGTATFPLTSAGVLGDDYFTLFRNDGTGTATIDPASSELVDGMSGIQVQPGESLILICTGTQWYSVGYGRSTLYQFTQLTKDVTAGGTITLSAAEAANKLITFIGNPSGAVSVVVPSVVAVYYTQSAISTAQTVTLKTAAGSGVGITQGARIIALCDGTNVVSAQSAVANASVSLTDGSSTAPSLFFATQTNTGLYKSGTQDVGVTVAGGTSVVFGSTGPQASTIGANSTQRHTVPAVTSDTVTLNGATQTLTNKTIVAVSNTITTAASGNLAATELNAALAELQGDIDTRALSSTVNSHISSSTAHGVTGNVVGTIDTQTLQNKTLDGTNSLSGNLRLTGTGARITGDFSNATIANRVMFQTSVANANTNVSGLPNGTGTATNFNAYSASDPANASYGAFSAVGSTDIRVTSGQTGTGTYLPMTFYTGGSEKLRIAADSTGTIEIKGTAPRITGDFSNATIANRVMFQSSTVNGNTTIGAIPNGTATAAEFRAYSESGLANGAVAGFQQNSTDLRIFTGVYGTGTYLPMTFYAGGSERMRINPSTGAVTCSSGSGGLGYGTGAGGTVTQVTSKSTAVTLNKPTGEITMNNAALAAGASVTFDLNNTLINPTGQSGDALVVVPYNNAQYRVEVAAMFGNAARIRVTNVTGVSLSEALVISFAVIKGARA